MLDIEKFELTVSDYVYIFTIFILIFIGLSAIYSASYQVESSYLKANFSRQVVWFLIGTFFLIITVVLPTRVLFTVSYWFYGFSILLLILILVLSDVSVSRWITIGGVQFQPSEFMKVSTVLALARYLSFKKRNLNKIKEISIAFGLILLPFLLISQQPDLGTALVFLAVILPILYWAGLPTFYLLVIIMPFVVLLASFNYYAFFAAMIFTIAMLLFFRSGLLVFLSVMIFNIIIGIFTPFLWNHLQGYQKHRILTFLGVEIDPHGLSYQIIQSKVAIGSGGFFGRGFGQSRQKFQYLPEVAGDSIFAIAGEELGFIRITLLIGLFLALTLRGIKIAKNCEDKFGSLLAGGIVSWIIIQAFIHMAGVTSLVPFTGIPLPFISYGGSALVVSLIGVGIIGNISKYSYH